MTGLDAFCALLGAGCFLFLTVAAIHIPEAIRTVERLLAKDQPRADSAEPPWGPRT